MTIEYKYKIWRNVFMLCQPYVWYSIDPNRKDYNDFIEALKDFHQQWGLLQFSNDFSMYMKIDPIVYMNEIISSDQRNTEVTDSKAESSRYGDFYTKAYEPDTLSKQTAKDHQPELKPMPGLEVVDGKYVREKDTFLQELVSCAQSNDLPSEGTLIPNEQKSSVTEPKNEPNIFTKKLEQLKKEKEDDCEF